MSMVLAHTGCQGSPSRWKPCAVRQLCVSCPHLGAQDPATAPAPQWGQRPLHLAVFLLGVWAPLVKCYLGRGPGCSCYQMLQVGLCSTWPGMGCRALVTGTHQHLRPLLPFGPLSLPILGNTCLSLRHWFTEWSPKSIISVLPTSLGNSKMRRNSGITSLNRGIRNQMARL